jgi:hypothetical protein
LHVSQGFIELVHPLTSSRKMMGARRRMTVDLRLRHDTNTAASNHGDNHHASIEKVHHGVEIIQTLDTFMHIVQDKTQQGCLHGPR